MTTRKIAVSLPAELVVQAQRAVAEGRASSVSSYVAGALEEKAKLDDLAALLAEMLAETGGPLTAVERRAADEALGRSAPARAAASAVGRTRERAPAGAAAKKAGRGTVGVRGKA